MATGIVKGEKHSEDALTADVIADDPFPLPSSSDQVTFEYPNKVSKDELLGIENRSYVQLDSNQKILPVESFTINSLLWADNLFALHDLRNHYSEKVDLIYLDPPYGTGLEFHSRDLKHAYKDVLGVTAYLEFMRRRLILMRELLSPTGSIYLHIGHQMLSHLKVIMDEVFGSQNFKNIIVRKKCSSKNYTKNQYPNLNDYILFYTKGKDYKWNRPGVPASKDWINKEYTKSDSRGRYKLVPIHAPGTRNGETGKPWRDMNPPPGKHWQVPPSKLEQLDKDGYMHWSKNGNPRRKVYLPEDKQLPLTDYWDGYRDAHHQSIKITGYPTEKNLEMLKQIVSASSDPGDIVLDPFCGSGTTLHAAEELGRKWFGIDQSMTAMESTVNRLRHGLVPMGDFVKKDSPKIVDMFSSHEQNDLGSEKNVSKPISDFRLYVDEQFYLSHKSQVKKVSSI